MFKKLVYSETFQRQLDTNRWSAASHVLTVVARNKNVNADYVPEEMCPSLVPNRSPCNHGTVASNLVIDLKFIRYSNWLTFPMITEISTYSFSIVHFDVVIKHIVVSNTDILQWSMIKYTQTASCSRATEIHFVCLETKKLFWCALAEIRCKYLRIEGIRYTSPRLNYFAFSINHNSGKGFYLTFHFLLSRCTQTNI